MSTLCMASTASSTQPTGCKGGGRNITRRIHPKNSFFVRVCGCLRMSADRKYETDMSAALVWRSVEKVLPSGFPCACGVCQEGESCWDTWDMSARCPRDVQPAESCLPKDVCGFCLKLKNQRCMGHRLRSDSGTRLKFHYALHLQEQIHRWRRHIDCFAGERKYRVFKSIVAPRLTRLNCFNRSTLLQMTELTTSHLESEYTGQLIGKPTQGRGANNGARNIS